MTPKGTVGSLRANDLSERGGENKAGEKTFLGRSTAGKKMRTIEKEMIR